jgi:hypothetical protein
MAYFPSFPKNELIPRGIYALLYPSNDGTCANLPFVVLVVHRLSCFAFPHLITSHCQSPLPDAAAAVGLGLPFLLSVLVVHIMCIFSFWLLATTTLWHILVARGNVPSAALQTKNLWPPEMFIIVIVRSSKKI